MSVSIKYLKNPHYKLFMQGHLSVKLFVDIRDYATGQNGRLYRPDFPEIARIKSTGHNHFALKSGNYHIRSAIKVASVYYRIHAEVNQLTESTKLRPLA
jgi:hypothetical protein